MQSVLNGVNSPVYIKLIICLHFNRPYPINQTQKSDKDNELYEARPKSCFSSLASWLIARTIPITSKGRNNSVVYEPSDAYIEDYRDIYQSTAAVGMRICSAIRVVYKEGDAG